MASPRVGGSYRLRSTSYPFRVRGAGIADTGTGAFAAAAASLHGVGTGSGITGTGAFAAAAASLASTGASTSSAIHTGTRKKRPALEFKPVPLLHITGKGGFEAAPCLLKGFGEVGPDPRLLRDDEELLLLLV